MAQKEQELEPKEGLDLSPQQRVPRPLAESLVQAALRPYNLDVVELRRVLLALWQQGFDPRELYERALQKRAPGLPSPPPEEEVLPQGVRDELARLDQELDQEDEDLS